MKIETLAFSLAVALVALACEGADTVRMNGGGDTDTDADTDTDTDTGTATETDTDTGTGTDDPDGGEILPDCSACPAVGTDLENLRCAIDLCDDAVFLGQTYSSPTVTNPAKLDISRAAVARFGAGTNDLKPLYPVVDGSYVLMATGYAVPANPPDAYDHNQILSGTLWQPDGPGVPDPFAPYEWDSYDVLEWRLELKAPEGAHGFRIHYVFFSVEYDEYVGKDFNDKFYMILEAASTNAGAPTVINFTDCRPGVPADYVCPADMPACAEGDELCYLAINSGLSECCWYDGCTTMAENTDITGTGFECGTADVDYVGDYSMGFTYGSSTGWLYTEWPIEPGEEFAITFHIHDTADAILDSEVILDKFVFVGDPEPGTGVVIE
jgi:hypothetical protein